MGALVSVHNDGPDAVEIRVGRRSILLQAGQDFRVSTATRQLEVAALAPISADDLSLHMSGRLASVATDANRYAED